MNNNEKTRKIRLVVVARKTNSIKLESCALAVRLFNKPVARFPLKNLLSIKLIGDYRGSVAPFIRCVKQGIPVTFYSTRGQLEAILSGKVPEQIMLVNWLEYCEFDYEYQEIYQCWLDEQIRHLCSISGIKGYSSENMVEQLYDFSFKPLSMRYSQSARQDLTEWLEGMIKTEITLITAEHGLSPSSQISNKVQNDILPILTAYLSVLFVRWCEANRTGNIEPHLISLFYNEVFDQIKYVVTRMFHQLNFRFEVFNN